MPNGIVSIRLYIVFSFKTLPFLNVHQDIIISSCIEDVILFGILFFSYPIYYSGHIITYQKFATVGGLFAAPTDLTNCFV